MLTFTFMHERAEINNHCNLIAYILNVLHVNLYFIFVALSLRTNKVDAIVTFSSTLFNNFFFLKFNYFLRHGVCNLVPRIVPLVVCAFGRGGTP